MGRQGKIKVFCFAALACASVLACSAALAVEPPGWWDDPNRGTSELMYVKASAEGCHTEEAARQKAWDAGLATLRKRITDNTNLWPRIQLAGTDIAFESIQEDSWGNWYAWLLVSYPRAQFEKALRRAEEAAEKAQARTSVFVFPIAFTKESEEQYPEVVQKYKALGYGNAIWQTVDNLLYKKGYEIVTAPSFQTRSILDQFFGQSFSQESQTIKTPDTILHCNMNFFKVDTESISWGVLVRNSEYHVSLKLAFFANPHSNVATPGQGDARDKDLLVATQKAAELAVDDLMENLQNPGQ